MGLGLTASAAAVREPGAGLLAFLRWFFSRPVWADANLLANRQSLARRGRPAAAATPSDSCRRQVSLPPSVRRAHRHEVSEPLEPRLLGDEVTHLPHLQVVLGRRSATPCQSSFWSSDLAPRRAWGCASAPSDRSAADPSPCGRDEVREPRRDRARAFEWAVLEWAVAAHHAKQSAFAKNR